MVKLPIDENHSTQLAAEAGGAAPARGFITALTAEADGIWATIEWTEAGRALMADGAYAYLSPVMLHTKEGQVLALRSVALTNSPAVPELALLTSREEDPVDLKALRAALGLAETADEAAIVAAATAARQAETALLTRIATAAGVSGQVTADALVSTLTARAAAGDPAQLQDKVALLETKLSTLTQAQLQRDAELLVDGAIRAGKPVVALRDHMIARCVAGQMAAVQSELAALPSINAGGIVAPPADGGTVSALTADEKKVARQMGLSEADMLAAKKKETA
jgi:phage I-like protein